MKLHHIAAVFALICGGLLAYIKSHQGNTEGAIWIGIICTLLGIFAFCYEKFRPRLKLEAIAYNVIFIGLMAAYAASTGDIASAIFLGIGSIGGCVLHFFQDTPFVKEKIRPWL